MRVETGRGTEHKKHKMHKESKNPFVPFVLFVFRFFPFLQWIVRHGDRPPHMGDRTVVVA